MGLENNLPKRKESHSVCIKVQVMTGILSVVEEKSLVGCQQESRHFLEEHNQYSADDFDHL